MVGGLWICLFVSLGSAGQEAGFGVHCFKHTLWHEIAGSVHGSVHGSFCRKSVSRMR